MQQNNSLFEPRSDSAGAAEIEREIDTLRRQLFSDDITAARNRLWLFENKLARGYACRDSGIIVSTVIPRYDIIVKEYGENVGHRLLKLSSDYMMASLREHFFTFDIVRYHNDNFLFYLYETGMDAVLEQFANMQTSMATQNFKHRFKMFRLSFDYGALEYIENEPFASVLDQLDEKLFHHNL